MTTVKTTLLLLLLGVTTAAIEAQPDHCEGRNVTVATTHLKKVYGEWVLVWAVSDDPTGHELLPNVSSSHVELKLRSDNKTIEYNERNMYLGNTCTSYFLNLTIPDDDEHHFSVHNGVEETNGVRKMFNDSAEVSFLESCDQCLTILYKSQSYGQYLMIYKRHGHHGDMDQMKAAQPEHVTLAQCLNFSMEHVFVYDGVSELCHEKSTPEHKSEEN